MVFVVVFVGRAVPVKAALQVAMMMGHWRWQRWWRAGNDDDGSDSGNRNGGSGEQGSESVECRIAMLLAEVEMAAAAKAVVIRSEVAMVW